MAKGTKHILVIGGGLSGLSAAWFIQDKAREAGLGLRLTLLEAESRLGGKIGTLEEQFGEKGVFRCETGPNGFLDSKPQGVDLCRRLGIGDRLLASNDNARKRFIYSNGALRKLPEDPLSFLRSDLLSWQGKARIAAEVLAKPRRDPTDEVLGDFVRRRLGQEALEVLIDPMASGIFAGNPENMSVAACFPKVTALEARFGGMVRGMLGMKKAAQAAGRQGAASAGPGGTLMSFKNGMAELVESLGKRIEGGVRTGVEVTRLLRGRNGFTASVRSSGKDGSVEADAVVLAVPAYSAEALLSQIDPGVASTMRTIPYAAMAVAHLGYDLRSVPMPLDGFGYLIPHREGRRILGALWASSIFIGRAPEGMAMVTVMMGGAKDPVTPRMREEDVVAIARAELSATMGLSAEPAFTRVLCWDRAIPQYTWGHLDRVRSIRNRLAETPGLFLTGNAFFGVGVNECVGSGQDVAAQVVAFMVKK